MATEHSVPQSLDADATSHAANNASAAFAFGSYRKAPREAPHEAPHQQQPQPYHPYQHQQYQQYQQQLGVHFQDPWQNTPHAQVHVHEQQANQSGVAVGAQQAQVQAQGYHKNAIINSAIAWGPPAETLGERLQRSVSLAHGAMRRPHGPSEGCNGFNMTSEGKRNLGDGRL